MHPVFGEAANKRRAVNAIDYTSRLRRIGVISMLVVGVAAACLVAFGKIPDEEYVPFIAVLIGFVPMALFMERHRPICEKCHGVMKFKAGFPTIVFRCSDCGDVVDTGVHPVY